MVVGMHVARCATGLGMRVIATDPYASPTIATQNSVELTTLDEVLSRSHFLSVHAPLIASTKGLIGAEELAQLQPGARVLNVARGGIIDEEALLSALESGHIAGAAIDVFSSEPPTANSSATKLIAHPNVVATPHLGASTAEAQVQVAQDVCQQILSILSGQLPSSAVNAPIILPEELKRLQPYVSLVEKMGDLYIQHYSTQSHHFNIIYEGDIAEINTKPLFAALIRGLTKSVSEYQVNIVNATLVAKDRGIIVNENHSRERPDLGTYSSLITLKSKDSDQLISGFVSDNTPRIVRLDRFTTSFVPQGYLLICHNYDRPGMIGKVGGLLGIKGVNISYMSVAPVAGTEVTRAGEALMILGVDREVGTEVLREIQKTEGIVDVKIVNLG
jgi:D-3-phosphoglycerate dehydrogenase / 2-oxoglutarate reductase